MKRLLVSLALASSLAGCAGLGVIESSTVNPNYAAAAVNAFNTVETVAAAYMRLPPCISGSTPVCRDAGAAGRIAPLIRTGETAKHAVLAAIHASHGGAIPVASYNTLQAITDTLNSVYTNYGVAKN